MSDTSYSFTKQINSDQLTAQLTVFCTQMNVEEDADYQLLRIETIEEDIFIWFNQELSENAETQLNTLIDEYEFVADYISEEDQDQVDTLIAYLSNANTMIANTARAVIVLNLAPRLGPELIATINVQIAERLGA